MYSWLRDGLIPGVSALLISLWLYAWFSFFLATGDGTATMRYPFAWLLEPMLARTGFQVRQVAYSESRVFAAYTCVRA